MAINAYTGLQGSGKSYEAVLSVILPALRDGRRVVTNVDGLNEELCRKHLVERYKADPEKVGSVVIVTNERIVKPAFFPDEERPDRDSVVQAGDLVVIDEAWRFWGTAEKISHEHMQFFRMHRHYVHKTTGVTCDLVLMVQAIADLHRNLRAVVELTARMTKIKTLGLTSTYRVELYEGGRTTKNAKFETFVRRYDKRIFPLYKSYSGANGTEKTVDKRQNVLRNPRIYLVGSLVLAMGAVSVSYLYRFFNGFGLAAEPSSTEVASDVLVSDGTISASQPVRPSTSSEWRVSGEVVIRGERYIALTGTSGHIRFEPASMFVGRGWTLVGEVEGQRVATWTGGPLTPPSVEASAYRGGL